jgi:uncharacterized membrane protein YraQ (UPF0718 family)
MSNENKSRGIGGWIFLSLVIICYGLVGLMEPKATIQAWQFFKNVIWRVLPVLGLVFILLFVANFFLEPKWIKQYLGKGAGLKGWIVSIFTGILSVGPIYVWYSVLRELKTKGMRTALIATFLYSRAVKLPLLPLMIHYFGISYTLVLCLYLVLFAGINGLVVERLILIQKE